MTRRLVGRNSIPSLKPMNDEFLKIVEFSGIQMIQSSSFRKPNITKEFGQRNLSFQFHQIPSNSFQFREPNIICHKVFYRTLQPLSLYKLPVSFCHRPCLCTPIKTWEVRWQVNLLKKFNVHMR